MSEWIVPIKDEQALQILWDSFFQGPIIDDQGRRFLGEAQIARFNGLKIEVFSNEHPPPHFCVSHQGETANYRISDCYQISGGLRNFYRNVREWHGKHKQLLITAWDSRRPTGCPVGIYRE
jgi:hypothetical protein